MKNSVLVIDDDYSILSIFEYALMDYDIHLHTTHTCHLALDYLVTSPPVDVIFLDIKMPSMSGIDFLKRVSLPSSTKVIMMTGYSVDHLIKEAFLYGGTSVLYKPFDVSEIVDLALSKPNILSRQT